MTEQLLLYHRKWEQLVWASPCLPVQNRFVDNRLSFFVLYLQYQAI